MNIGACRYEKQFEETVKDRKYRGQIVKENIDTCSVYCAEIKRTFEVHNRYLKKKGEFVNIIYRQFGLDRSNFVAFIS